MANIDGDMPPLRLEMSSLEQLEHQLQLRKGYLRRGHLIARLQARADELAAENERLKARIAELEGTPRDKTEPDLA